MPLRGSFTLRNRQRRHPLDGRWLRQVVRTLLQDLLPGKEFELGIYCVGTEEFTRLNETFLRHQGPTDVIAFDYPEPDQPQLLRGEIFVCVDEALVQARRFHASWQSELVRYVVHGALHLCGYDDQGAADRRRMKQAEGRWLRHLADRYDLSRLG
jgi:probable rRNA maturation factor